jgi:hypothetical protein
VDKHQLLHIEEKFQNKRFFFVQFWKETNKSLLFPISSSSQEPQTQVLTQMQKKVTQIIQGLDQ